MNLVVKMFFSLIVVFSTVYGGGIIISTADEDGSSSSNIMRLLMKIDNQSNESINLSDYTIYYTFSDGYNLDYQIQRYYFGVDNSSRNINDVNVEFLNTNDNVIGNEVAKITFPAENVSANGLAELKIGIYKQDWSNFDESSHYSYGGTSNQYRVNDKVVVVKDGSIVFGIPKPDVDYGIQLKKDSLFIAKSTFEKFILPRVDFESNDKDIKKAFFNDEIVVSSNKTDQQIVDELSSATGLPNDSIKIEKIFGNKRFVKFTVSQPIDSIIHNVVVGLNIEKNYLVTTQTINSIQLNDTYADKQFLLNKYYLQEIWSNGNEKSKKVAIFDTGVDPDHPDLVGSVLPNGVSFVSDPVTEKDTTFIDENGHGTILSCVITAKRNNSFGIAGINDSAKIFPVKVISGIGYGSAVDIAKGLYYIADKTDIKLVNISLGTYTDVAYLKEAVDYAVSKGVVIVAAAGNEGENTRVYPAAYDNVIGVGSVDKEGNISNFSNYNQSSDIYALGENVVIPNQSDLMYNQNGTSISSAVVTGLLSMLNTGDNVGDLLEKLKNQGDEISFQNQDKYGSSSNLKEINSAKLFNIENNDIAIKLDNNSYYGKDSVQVNYLIKSYDSFVHNNIKLMIYNNKNDSVVDSVIVSSLSNKKIGTYTFYKNRFNEDEQNFRFVVIYNGDNYISNNKQECYVNFSSEKFAKFNIEAINVSTHQRVFGQPITFDFLVKNLGNSDTNNWNLNLIFKNTVSDALDSNNVALIKPVNIPAIAPGKSEDVKVEVNLDTLLLVLDYCKVYAILTNENDSIMQITAKDVRFDNSGKVVLYHQEPRHVRAVEDAINTLEAYLKSDPEYWVTIKDKFYKYFSGDFKKYIITGAKEKDKYDKIDKYNKYYLKELLKQNKYLYMDIYSELMIDVVANKVNSMISFDSHFWQVDRGVDVGRNRYYSLDILKEFGIKEKYAHSAYTQIYGLMLDGIEGKYPDRDDKFRGGAITLIKEYYKKDKYNDKYKYNYVADNLGRVLHLLTDLGTPEHIGSNEHGTGRPAFEEWMSTENGMKKARYIPEDIESIWGSYILNPYEIDGVSNLTLTNRLFYLSYITAQIADRFPWVSIEKVTRYFGDYYVQGELILKSIYEGEDGNENLYYDGSQLINVCNNVVKKYFNIINKNQQAKKLLEYNKLDNNLITDDLLFFKSYFLNDNDNDLKTIADYAYTNSIRAMAGLLYFFLVESDDKILTKSEYYAKKEEEEKLQQEKKDNIAQIQKSWREVEQNLYQLNYNNRNIALLAFDKLDIHNGVQLLNYGNRVNFNLISNAFANSVLGYDGLSNDRGAYVGVKSRMYGLYSSGDVVLKNYSTINEVVLYNILDNGNILTNPNYINELSISPQYKRENINADETININSFIPHYSLTIKDEQFDNYEKDLVNKTIRLKANNYYDKINVPSNWTLCLPGEDVETNDDNGSYFINELIMSSDSKIKVGSDRYVYGRNEQVELYINNKFEFNDRAEVVFGKNVNSSRFFVGVANGDVRLGSCSFFKGTLCVPRGTLEIFGTAKTNVIGQFVAKNIIVHQYKTVIFKPFLYYLGNYEENSPLNISLFDASKRVEVFVPPQNSDYVYPGYTFSVGPSPLEVYDDNENISLNAYVEAPYSFYNMEIRLIYEPLEEVMATKNISNYVSGSSIYLDGEIQEKLKFIIQKRFYDNYYFALYHDGIYVAKISFPYVTYK